MLIEIQNEKAKKALISCTCEGKKRKINRGRVAL